MWNLYIVKKWDIDVHGAKKGYPQGMSPCMLGDLPAVFDDSQDILDISHDLRKSNFSYFLFMIIQISMEIPMVDC